jgi:hypothetical protein
MTLLIDLGPTPENLDRALALFERVIGQSAPGSDELIAATYGAGVVHAIRGDFERALPYLIESGRM